MSSPWEPGISQAMQRHGGSNRSIPKIKPSLNGRPEEPSVADTLADEVSTVRRDHVYEEALAVAIRLASSRSGGAR